MKLDGQTLASTIIRDVTERRQLELLLRRRTHELDDFIENSSISMHRVTPDGIILWANQAELDLLGYTREEYIGQDIRKFHADPKVIEDLLGRVGQDGKPRNVSARLICKDGSLRSVLIDKSVYRENGEFVHTRCFTRDVTSRVKAEEVLREREERLRLIFNANQDPESVIRVEPGGRFVSEAFNQAYLDYARQFTSDPSQYLERGREELLRAAGIPENEIAGAVARWREVAVKKTPVRYDLTYVIGPDSAGRPLLSL